MEQPATPDVIRSIASTMGDGSAEWSTSSPGAIKIISARSLSGSNGTADTASKHGHAHYAGTLNRTYASCSPGRFGVRATDVHKTQAYYPALSYHQWTLEYSDSLLTCVWRSDLLRQSQ